MFAPCEAPAEHHLRIRPGDVCEQAVNRRRWVASAVTGGNYSILKELNEAAI